MASGDPTIGGDGPAAAFDALAKLNPMPARGSGTVLVDLKLSCGTGGVALTITRTATTQSPATATVAATGPAIQPQSEVSAAETPASSAAEDPATNAKLLAMLTSHLGAPSATGRWSTSTHEAVRTSEEAAAVRGATLASGAKAMLLATKPTDEFVVAIISASEKMDSKAFGRAGGFKSTKFANEDEVFWLTGCRPGAVPPFGSLWGLRTFVDTSLLEQGDDINFNSGLKTASVRMSTADYLEVEKPVAASFRG